MRAFPVGSAVENLAEMQKIQMSLVEYMGQEDTSRGA